MISASKYPEALNRANDGKIVLRGLRSRVIILLTLFEICSAVVQMGKLTPEPIAWPIVYHTLAEQSPEWIAAALLQNPDLLRAGGMWLAL